MPCESLRKAIGSRLPKDISILDACDAPPNFRSSRDAISKLYRYTIHNESARPVELLRQRYVYHYWHPLDIGRMQDAADVLVGEHDFAAFATTGHQRESTVRTVLDVHVQRSYGQVRIDVEGTGFLYNQVRNMVGTLLEVGRGRWTADDVRAILQSRDRTNAGPTAPARGLCLQWVRYDMTRSYEPDPWKQPREWAPVEDNAPNAEQSPEEADECE
jgi:tRNA pseudouridine38-40 synthase